VRKIEMGRFTYGYHRVMEMLAWSYCARAVITFNDLGPLLYVFVTLILFEAFRMLMEWRDIRNVIRDDEETASAKKKLEDVRRIADNRISWGLYYLNGILGDMGEQTRKCKQHGDTINNVCYTCRLILARENLEIGLNKTREIK
jgi:hypothetical protein